MDGIYKHTQLGFKDEPKLGVTSSLDVLFYNLDINTATLDFEVTKNGYPLLLSENHVNAYVIFMAKNDNNIFTIQDLEIVDGLNGVLRATVPTDFLKAVSVPNSTAIALGQVYISVNGKDDTVVMSEFDFKVKDALINQMSSDIKVSYIRTFDDLYEEIKTRIKEMENDIGNINTLVDEVRNAATDSKEDITKIKNDSIRELENIANTTNTSVQQQASQAISNIQSIFDEYTTRLNNETNDKINEVNEASDKVLESIEQNNLVTLEQTSNWQKHKLTNDSGNQILNFDSSNRMTNENLLSAKTGFYFNLEYNDSPSGATGFVYITENAGSGKKIYYSSYNRNDLYIKSYSNSTGWTEWENLSINYSDTGWLPLPLINGTIQAGSANLPKYRLVSINDTDLLFFKGAVKNITSRTMTFAKLPTNISQKISSYAEYSKVKINPYTNKSAIYNITMTNSGELKITFEPNSTADVSTPYYIEGTISL